MNAPTDFFPELIPSTYADADEARALAWGMVRRWFGALSYSHSEATHAEILASLDWPGIRDFVQDAALAEVDARIDFDDFAGGVRHQARRARREGLVVAAGKPRPRGGAADATGDLFSGDGSGDGRGAK